MTEHEQWPAQTTEEIIDAALPICDPHHHLWNAPDRRYLVPELFQDIGGGHNIVRTVFVESESVKKRDPLQKLRGLTETKFTHDITAPEATRPYGTTEVAAGIVGFADFMLGADVAPVLEAQLAVSDRLCGIRQICSWDVHSDIIHATNEPGMLLDSGFRQGVARLRKYGLPFETFIYHPQLPELVDLARALPDIPVILDHMGGPLGVGPYAGRRDEAMNDWKTGMTALSACPNVYIKLGGLGMSICGLGWNELDTPPDSTVLAEVMAPYFLWCIERFGVARCMFESNFPVDKVSYSYTVLWNAFKRICRDFSSDERTALFSGTAVKAYRLAADR